MQLLETPVTLLFGLSLSPGSVRAPGAEPQISMMIRSFAVQHKHLADFFAYAGLCIQLKALHGM